MALKLIEIHTSGILSASRLPGASLTSSGSGIYGFIRTACLPIATTPLKWRLVLRTAYILNSSTISQTPNQYNESETITKFEIMDGAPVRGETIPIRLFLGGFELTPTFRDVNKKFSTRYYLNLVLVDEENRRYFKQQEITIYRRRGDIYRLRVLFSKILPDQPTSVDDGFPPVEGQE
ncbi:vacuolar protein sorting-associated protein 26-domain-containing protein [Jimgerdemannia flammicorona]|uniref:Vacuolar protein sorting-associated protein 26-domain-containing protein n=1 Tax=Jimgerdemannia flammicorona TaxID=994334 RepID=A0A433DCY2_9FUNG|nr:vacuolar protein sorting-associated protein 26-domain-containing protein [Jimgerdemannia flammicorona]